jgi:hypothetical protein
VQAVRSIVRVRATETAPATAVATEVDGVEKHTHTSGRRGRMSRATWLGIATVNNYAAKQARRLLPLFEQRH